MIKSYSKPMIESDVGFIDLRTLKGSIDNTGINNTIIEGVLAMGNVALRGGIEHPSNACQGSVLTITPHRLPGGIFWHKCSIYRFSTPAKREVALQ